MYVPPPGVSYTECNQAFHIHGNCGTRRTCCVISKNVGVWPCSIKRSCIFPTLYQRTCGFCPFCQFLTCQKIQHLSFHTLLLRPVFGCCYGSYEHHWTGCTISSTCRRRWTSWFVLNRQGSSREGQRPIRSDGWQCQKNSSEWQCPCQDRPRSQRIPSCRSGQPYKRQTRR